MAADTLLAKWSDMFKQDTNLNINAFVANVINSLKALIQEYEP